MSNFLKNNKYFIKALYMDNKLDNYFIVGGKVKASVLKGILHNGYQDKQDEDIDGYKLDKELSGQRAQVYHNPATNHTIVNHRGTKGIHDMYTDVKLMLGYKKNHRFDHGKKVTDDAMKKYHNSEVTITGHSLGSVIAQEANKPYQKELITLNGAVTPHDLLQRQRDNEYHIRTEYDPVSVLHGLNPMRKDKNNTTIKSDSFNLLREHKTDVLDRLDPNHELGGNMNRNSKKSNLLHKIKEFLTKH